MARELDTKWRLLRAGKEEEGEDVLKLLSFPLIWISEPLLGAAPGAPGSHGVLMMAVGTQVAGRLVDLPHPLRLLYKLK